MSAASQRSASLHVHPCPQRRQRTFPGCQGRAERLQLRHGSSCDCIASGQFKADGEVSNEGEKMSVVGRDEQGSRSSWPRKSKVDRSIVQPEYRLPTCSAVALLSTDQMRVDGVLGCEMQVQCRVLVQWGTSGSICCRYAVLSRVARCEETTIRFTEDSLDLSASTKHQRKG